MLVQASLCRTCSETTLLVFPRGGSNGDKSFQIEDDQFTGDDTALNGVRLRCGDKHGNYYSQTVESGEGGWGHWHDSKWISCDTYPNQTRMFDYMVAFQLQVEADQVGMATYGTQIEKSVNSAIFQFHHDSP